jgi:hypothetical protein
MLGNRWRIFREEGVNVGFLNESHALAVASDFGMEHRPGKERIPAGTLHAPLD